MMFLDKCVATLGGCFLTLIFRVAPIIRQRKIIIDILKPMILLHYRITGSIKRPLKIIQKEQRERKKRVFINYFSRVLYYVVVLIALTNICTL